MGRKWVRTRASGSGNTYLSGEVHGRINQPCQYQQEHSRSNKNALDKNVQALG